MESKKRKKLRNTVILMCISFAVVLGLLIGGLGYVRYATNIKESYQNYAETLTAIIHSNIDPASFKKCIDEGEVDDGFRRVQAGMNQIKENSDAQYIYMIYYPEEPGGETIRYVMNAYTQYELEHEAGTISYLGDLAEKEDFSSEMRAEFQRIIAMNDETVHFYDNETQVAEAGGQTVTEYMKTAILPIRMEDGELVSLLCLDISMTQIYKSLWSYLAVVIAGSILIVGAFLTIFLVIINRRIIRPIEEIVSSAEDFVVQSRSVQEPSQLKFRELKSHTGDEIEFLGRRLSYMVHELVRYMTDIKEISTQQERIAAELDVAKQIQRNLYPCDFPAFPERKDFDIYAELHFACEAGGDFYNFFLVDSEHLCVMAGSVSDSGLPTTMFAVVTSTLMKNYAQLGYMPGRILAETNNEISKGNDAQLDVVAFLAMIDLKSGKLYYANAGNMVPLIKKSGQRFEELPNKRCIRMGSMENVPYFQQSVNLVQGDILCLYTPGLSETLDVKGNVYSDIDVKEKLDEITGQEVELERMAAAIGADVKRFRGEAKQEKDTTVILFRYYG